MLKMYRLISFIIFSLLFCVSSKAQYFYKIEGKIVNLPPPAEPGIVDGDSIELNMSRINIVKKAVVRNNEFAFTGTLKEPMLAMINYRGGGVKIFLDSSSYFLNLNEVSQINNNKTLYYTDYSLRSDSKVYNLWYKCLDSTTNFDRKKTLVLNKLKQAKNEDSIRLYKRSIMQIDTIIKAFYVNLTIENPDNTATAYWLQYAPDLSYKSYILLYNMLSEKVKTGYFGIKLLKKLNAIKSLDDDSLIDTKINTIIGTKVPVIQAISINGEKVVIDKTVYNKAKYTLIEFWASWCIPCKKVDSVLSAKTADYKKKGLNIIAFSMDGELDKWTNAVSKENAAWLQISDLKVINSPLAIFANVEAIPTNLLIDSNGMVVAQRIYGNELDAFLEKSN
jgi:thiol-disulfide isomerase/thioredoxin